MKNILNKIVHTLTLLVFGFVCYLNWIMLEVAPKLRQLHPQLQPEMPFTMICISLRPVLIVLPILAAVYCVWVWFRKADKSPSWVGYFAATMGVLVFVTIPVMIAAYASLFWAVHDLANIVLKAK